MKIITLLCSSVIAIRAVKFKGDPNWLRNMSTWLQRQMARNQ